MESSSRRSGFSVLKYPDFRLFWIGQLISNAGTQMQMVAVNWHVYILTRSALALGAIGLSRFIPIVGFSLIGGAFADAHNRKKTLLVTQSLLAVLAGTLAVVTFTHRVSVWIIYLVTILSAMTVSFDTPTRQAFIPSLVDRRDLANALSLNTIMFQTATVAGPGIAGFVIARFGPGMVYALNAFSFVAIIGALLAMRTNGEIQGKSTAISFTSVKEGLRFVRSRTIIWSTTGLDFLSTFFSSATTLLPIYAKDILFVGPQELGLLYAATPIGALFASSVLAHTIRKIHKQGLALTGGVLLYGLATVIFGFSRFFPLSFFALILLGAGDSVSTIIRNTIRQITTPDHLRGRMTSITMIFFMGGPQLGEFEAGLVAAAAGAPFSVVSGGIATLVILTFMIFRIPVLRTFTVDHMHAPE